MERRTKERWTIFFQILGVGLVIFLILEAFGWLDPSTPSIIQIIIKNIKGIIPSFSYITTIR